MGWKVLNSKDFGVPQNRERVFIIGHLRGTPRPQVFPLTTTNSKTTKANEIVVPVLTTDRPEKLQNGRRFKTNGEPSFTLTGQDIHGVMVNRKEGVKKEVDIAGTLSSSDWRGLNRNQDQTAVQLYGKTGQLQIRRLTPIECERLQGFPDNWTQLGDLIYDKKKHRMRNEVMSDTQRYKMMGNAVTTNVVAAIAERLL
jgi:DNA (cytosine-5)-methyltransferase 1